MREHSVTVLTLWANDRDVAALNQLREACHETHAFRCTTSRSLLNCIRAVPGSEPLQSAYSWSEEAARRLADLAASADVIHVEHLRGVRYALHARWLRPGQPPVVVWDSVDCISYLFEQAARMRRDRVGRSVNQFELSRTRAYEGWLVRTLDHVLVTSETDRQQLLRLARQQDDSADSTEQIAAKIQVVANGVDIGYFSPPAAPRNPNQVIFSGKMSYHANVSAATFLLEKVMPYVWTKRPDTQLVLAGQDPPQSVQRAAARCGGRVRVTGAVDDMRPYVSQSAVGVVPLVYGAGSQYKVLEAMACATPVVATSRAVSALAAEPGRDLLVADGAHEFAELVVALLEDAGRRAELGQAGRRYVEAHHSWNGIAAQLEKIYSEALAPHSVCEPTYAEAASVR
jgi:glycosyltransferase involved in cell wall biosynthesis